MRKNLFFTVVMLTVLSVFVSAAEYDKILGEMRSLVQENPEYVQMMDIGKNDQGNFIYGLRFENKSVEGNKTPQLLVGTHHGNERQSAYLCTEAARLLMNVLKDKDHALNESLSSKVFYLVPVLNVGGFNSYDRRERDSNGWSLDPNRDYPDPCVEKSNFRLSSTRNLSQFVAKQSIVAAVTVHGYIGTFTYPWGIYTSNTKTMDDDLYSLIAEKCCEVNNYRYGTHTDVIYPASGAFEDWCYHKHGTWTMLLELSRSADLKKDALAVMTYFALIPTEKSTQHVHKGKCTQSNIRGEEGRP